MCNGDLHSLDIMPNMGIIMGIMGIDIFGDKLSTVVFIKPPARLGWYRDKTTKSSQPVSRQNEIT
jgi:hypothetical protein